MAFSASFSNITKTSAIFDAEFTGGDSSYGRNRYVLLSVNGTEYQITSSNVGGSDSYFSKTITGLVADTTYAWEATLGYIANNKVTWTTNTVSGSFKTKPLATYTITNITYKSVDITVTPDVDYARYRFFIKETSTEELIYDKTYNIDEETTITFDGLMFNTGYTTNIGATNRVGTEGDPPDDKPKTDYYLNITNNNESKLFTTKKGYGVRVNYYANGGSGAPDSELFTNNTSSVSVLISSSDETTKPGYTLLGWSKSSTATTATYKAGSTYAISGSSSINELDLYAVWKANTYYAKLVYNANGGSGAPSSSSKNATPNDVVATIEFTVSSTKPSKSGYKFLGWARTNTATTAAYFGGDTYTITTASTSSSNPTTQTLYAVWEPIYKIKITYNSNGGGSNIPSSQPAEASTLMVPITLSEKVPTRTGFIFYGWSLDPNTYYKDVEWSFGDTIELEGGLPNAKPYTLYAIWDQIQYGVEIHYYPGSILEPYSEFYWGETENYYITLDTASVDGRTFLGWSEDENATSAEYSSGGRHRFKGSLDGFEPYYLYGVWVYLYSLYVYLYANDGTGDDGFGEPEILLSSSESNKITFTFPSEPPVRDGYRFLGWSKDSNATTAEYLLGESVEFDGDSVHAFYGVWKTTYTVNISYDANGGTGAPASHSESNDESSTVSVTIATTSPSMTGYSFAGWSESPTATTASYYDGKSYDFVVDSSQGTTRNITLYAVWSEVGAGSVWIYTSSGWKKATPYVYTNNGWKKATAYVYTSSGWKQAIG